MKTRKTSLSPRKKPVQARAQSTIHHILDASAQILNQTGEEEFTTNKVAVKAGVSIGSLYQYFPNKDSIISALMENFMQQQFDIIKKEMSRQRGKSLESTIRAIVRASLESKRKTTRFNRFLAQMVFKIDGMKQLQRADQEIAEYFKGIVMEYKNELREGDLDWMIFNMINIMKMLPVCVIFSPERQLDDPAFEDELCLLMFRYLKR